MIHWVVALRSEAEPLIDRLQLSPAGEAGRFEFFEGAGSRLIVSGVAGGRLPGTSSAPNLKVAARKQSCTEQLEALVGAEKIFRTG